MSRAPRYHASGDCIHADPLAVISPAGRTFSVYPSDTIEISGLIAAGRNGLVFYDNDREVFLNRPLFTDILSSHPTPTQLAIINEFRELRTWKSVQDFFTKLDKVLVIDQFRRYLSDPEGGHRFFSARVAQFCDDESIPLRQVEGSRESAFDNLVSAIAATQFLKHGLFRAAIPDIAQSAPDTLLAKSSEAKRAERWLSVARLSGALPAPVRQLEDERGDTSRSSMLREVVAKYMREMESWENSPLMELNGGAMSRRDAEEFLFGSHTAYCPSPLGFTPRLRYAFAAPEALAEEPLEVKIAFVSALETKIRHLLGFPVKLLYMQERHCFLLKSIGDGGGELSMAYSDGADFELGILFASDTALASMAQAVEAIASATVPALAERDIEEARRFIAEQRASDEPEPDSEPELDESYGETDENLMREGM